MLQDYKSKTVAVIDNGLFVEIAATLAKSFGKVYYFSPWRGAFPKSNARLVGTGIKGVTRCNDYHDIIDEVDLWIFPDVYYSGIQLDLEARGKRVWGSRKGEELELNRRASKEHCKSLGIPVGPYVVLTGIDALREYLKLHDDQWIKCSLTRGDFESFHSENYKNIEPRLDELEHNLGAKKKIYEFIVEQGIPDAVEIGYDGFSVDGQFPTQACNGIEVKDKGYIGLFQPYKDMAPQIQEINSKLAPTLKEFKYRNFFAVEARITQDGKPLVIDPCCRAGSPPSELLQLMYTNLPDIFWYGAEGTCIDPVPADKWGAELLIHSSWADKNWQAVQFPPEIRDNVKFRNLAIINGEYYVVPQSVGLPEIGAVVAVGPTLEEAVETCKEYSKHVKGYFIDMFADSLDEAQDEIEKLKKFGIDTFHNGEGYTPKKPEFKKPKPQIQMPFQQPMNNGPAYYNIPDNKVAPLPFGLKR